MKLYYFYNLKALWDSQGKIKMYYGISRVKKQQLGKRSIKLENYIIHAQKTSKNSSTKFIVLHIRVETCLNIGVNST